MGLKQKSTRKQYLFKNKRINFYQEVKIIAQTFRLGIIKILYRELFYLRIFYSGNSVHFGKKFYNISAGFNNKKFYFYNPF